MNNQGSSFQEQRQTADLSERKIGTQRDFRGRAPELFQANQAILRNERQTHELQEEGAAFATDSITITRLLSGIATNDLAGMKLADSRDPTASRMAFEEATATGNCAGVVLTRKGTWQ